MIDRILIADDEFLVREMLEETVRRTDIEVVTAGSGEEAIEILQKEEFQMAFVDLKMGKLTGMDVLRNCRENCPRMLFVIMTAYGTLETAIEAMKLGAFDFVIKPFSPDQMDIVIEKGKLWLQLNERDQYFQKEISNPAGYKVKAIGDSPSIQEINRLARRVAPTDATVLITGESGTGKELIASEIFRLSDPGSSKPYIRMNCAAVPENLLESELFGHEKGAFTGASERRIGRFELADGGTLLLDEIGEITPAMQSKLLRVLQESEFERVGGSKTIKVNVRVIATTNRDLKEEVKNGNFREDLFYRLNVFPVSLPPLRDRIDDSVKIARYFLAHQEKKLGRTLKFDKSGENAILNYSWPGNIRELENVIERIAILEDGPIIDAKAFPPDILNLDREKTSAFEDDQNLFDMKAIEKLAIKKALHRSKGNKTKAAELLGFNVRTLRNKLNEYKAEGSLDEELTELIFSES